MHGFGQGDTISAIATPPGAGGIGVVRISGQDARGVLAKLWEGCVQASKFEPRKLYLGRIVWPAKSAPTCHRIDRVMAVFMPAPKTYTGEDIVEISCHGSPVILKTILEASIAAGARLASPGEFTRRAFMAGKLDLAQAEAVCDLINASCERAAKTAALQIEGLLSKKVRALGDALAAIRAETEASIDFPEEEFAVYDMEAIASKIREVSLSVSHLSQTYSDGRMVREGVRVAIVGRPNAGKSSIFNCLVGRDRAIVHWVEGTTRDVIEDRISLGGICFSLRDTAGFRPDAHEVEELGITKSRAEIEAADVVVVVFDGSLGFGPEDDLICGLVPPSKACAAINKCDLPKAFDTTFLKDWPARGLVHTSAVTGEGIDELKIQLGESVSLHVSQDEGEIVTNARHKAMLDEAIAALNSSQEAIASGDPSECVAAHLSSAQDALGGITGAVTTEDILDQIFSRFCVGK